MVGEKLIFSLTAHETEKFFKMHSRVGGSKDLLYNEDEEEGF